MSAAATYEKASDQLGAIGAPSGKAARVGLCSMCGKAGASLTCTRCRDPLYCNRDCQVRDGMTPFVHVFGYFTVGTPKTPPFCAPIFVCNYTGLTSAFARQCIGTEKMRTNHCSWREPSIITHKNWRAKRGGFRCTTLVKYPNT